MMEEKNKEFEKKMEVNQILIDTLIKENVKKKICLKVKKKNQIFLGLK